MELNIKGSPKEIAALVVALQERQEEKSIITGVNGCSLIFSLSNDHIYL